MTRRLRVLMVGRHFWPLGSFDSAGHLMDLAVGLHRHGFHIEVVTPRHGSGWTERFTFREIMVHRPLPIFRSGWATRSDRTASRYVRDLTSWLTKTAAGVDLILSDRAKEEAIAVVDAARALNIPSIVRIGGHGDGSDLAYFADNRLGARCKANALAADATVVNDARSHRRWLTLGADAATVHRMAPYLIPIDAAATERSALRHSLARINGDLLVPEGATVLLSVERMRRESGLIHLVESAMNLAKQFTDLQFWLIGDGPRRDWVYNRLRGDGLRQSTAMPGSFGSHDDILIASDLMVHSGDEGFESQVPRAIMAAVPLVVANTETARDFFGFSKEEIQNRDAGTSAPASDVNPSDVNLVHWYQPDDTESLRRAVSKVVFHREESRRKAESLRRRMQQLYPREELTNRYSSLIRDLVGWKSELPSRRVAEASE
ncbi:MAG: glycosyltransferase [Planctomycetota bacterium]